MALTGKQAHVLENLDRVQPTLYKLMSKVERRRFQLDGWDCTYQITSLVAKRLVAYTPGKPVRLQTIPTTRHFRIDPPPEEEAQTSA